MKSRSRRSFLKDTVFGGAILGLSPRTHRSVFASQPPSERVRIGMIGVGNQGGPKNNMKYFFKNIVALCDLDKNYLGEANDFLQKEAGIKATLTEDYRRLLDAKDVDAVVVTVPDQWHALMTIEACKAGKDVYCEKPLTLTIDEGKQLRKVVRETGRVVQVGSWQRSDSRFRLAVEMIRQGRIGQLKEVEVILGKNEQGGPFEVTKPPKNLNWKLWQGQTPEVPYIAERCHYTFRWWLEYSGGQMTDWGAHHIDIAQWAIDSYPVEIEGQATYPENDGSRYNVPRDFEVRYRFANGVSMSVLDNGRNGITFIGTEGKLFVNRGTIAGKAVDDLAKNPLAREKFQLYQDNLERPERAGKLDAIINHMGNFFDCAVSRATPLSDIESQHRSVSTCHLGNIALKLGRKLTWDPTQELFPQDQPANDLLSRNGAF